MWNVCLFQHLHQGLNNTIECMLVKFASVTSHLWKSFFWKIRVKNWLKSQQKVDYHGWFQRPSKQWPVSSSGFLKQVVPICTSFLQPQHQPLPQFCHLQLWKLPSWIRASQASSPSLLFSHSSSPFRLIVNLSPQLQSSHPIPSRTSGPSGFTCLVVQARYHSLAISTKPGLQPTTMELSSPTWYPLATCG